MEYALERGNVKDKGELSSTSLLRYPGGKTRAVEMITRFFPSDLKTICSPFFGGGSIEIYMAAKGVKVLGFDAFNPLVEFWQCVQTTPTKLAEKVMRYFPLTKDQFYALQKKQHTLNTQLERAAAYYVLNRSSFSGSTLSGGMSPGHPRFTLSSIERILQFNNPNFQVEKMSFETSIKANKKTFLYLDPPYLIDSTLYGKNGDAHKNFDHHLLFKILHKRSNWILSYNDCEQIRTLYADYCITTPSWKYGMSNDKTSKEVLIFSHDISPSYGNPNRIRKSV